MFFPWLKGKVHKPFWGEKRKQTKTMEKKHFSLTAKYTNQGYHYALTQGVLY